MNTVTLSPKFQVVIPSAVRQCFDLKPGEKFQVLAYQHRIELVPVRPVKELRGMFKGMDTRLVREKDRL